MVRDGLAKPQESEVNKKARLKDGMATAGLAVSLAALSACAYFVTQSDRAASRDSRIRLGPHERLLLYRREIPGYTCDAKYFLVCDRGGSVQYSCTCVLP